MKTKSQLEYEEHQRMLADRRRRRRRRQKCLRAVVKKESTFSRNIPGGVGFHALTDRDADAVRSMWESGMLRLAPISDGTVG